MIGLLLLAAPGLDLTVLSDEDCPDQAAVRQVVAELTELGDGPPRVAVLVTLSGPPYTADVVFEDGTSRNLAGETCRAVAQAAALVVSLYLDALPAPAEPRKEAPRERVPFHPSVDAPAPTPAGRTAFVSVRAQAGVTVGLLPGAAPAFELSAAFTTAGLRFELGSVLMPPRTARLGEAGADLQAYGAVGRICRVRAFAGATFGLCAVGTAGAILGRGFGVETPEAGRTPYLSAGGSLRFGLPLGTRARVVPEIMGEIPFSRPTFTLAGAPLHRPAAWVIGLRLGGEVLF